MSSLRRLVFVFLHLTVPAGETRETDRTKTGTKARYVCPPPRAGREARAGVDSARGEHRKARDQDQQVCDANYQPSKQSQREREGWG